MARARRLQLMAGAGSVALLALAWAFTAAGEREGGADGVARSSSVPANASTTTEVAPSTTAPDAPRNLKWGALAFTDVTEAAGLSSPHSRSAPTGEDFQTGGAAVADIDGDGDQDLLLTRIDLPLQLLLNDGKGRFTDVAASSGLGGRDSFAAAVWADVEGDGDLDLLLTGAGRRGPALFVNDGSAHFADVSVRSGLGGLGAVGLSGTASYGAAFDDWDRDGDLDLVMLHWQREVLDRQLALLPPPSVTGDPAADAATMARYEPCVLAAAREAEPAAPGAGPNRSRLFRNDGRGRFADVTDESGVDLTGVIGFQPRFADVDGDGWDDLLVTGDYCTSRLFRNDEGRGFVDRTVEAGVGTDQNGMGSVVDDVDGDGNLDWFVTGIAYPTADGTCPEGIPACSLAGNRLYLGDGKGRFTDGTDRFGVRDGSWGWGAVAADLNQDGRTDLLVANGVRDTTGASTSSPGAVASDGTDGDATRLWVATPELPWPQVADVVGIRDRTNAKAAVAFDADGDGDLDLLFATTESRPLLYRNDTPRGSANHWLGLRLRQAGPNPYAIGAQVRVDLGDGSPPRLALVRADGSFQSGDPTDVHVGLGGVERVAKVEIRWPGATAPQVLTDVAADQLLAVTRP